MNRVSKVIRRTNTWLRRGVFLIEIVIGGIIIASVLYFDDRPGWTRLNGGAVTAIGIVVAAWVGLLTLHTLRHSIGLSQQEAASRMDALSPIVMVTLFNDKALMHPLARSLDLEFINGGTGPAVDVTATVVGVLFNYEVHAQGFFPQTLIQGQPIRVGVFLRPGSEFKEAVSLPTLPEDLPPDVRQNPEEKKNAKIIKHYAAERTRVHSIWKAAMDSAPNEILVATYRDVYGRQFSTTVEFIRFEGGQNMPWPHIELGKTAWHPPTK